jgi:ribosome maturation factor RimP
MMDQEKLRNIAEICAEQLQAHLVDLTTHQHRHNLMIEVFVDTDKGVATDELAAINRRLGKEFDAFFGAEQSFSLTVSSPGLERPLEFPWQYNRHKGRQIRMTVGDPEEPRIVEGELLGIENDVVSVQGKKETHAIPLGEILKAVMKISTR